MERGKNHFTVLPEGWIQVRHFSGMPVYLHKQTRVVTLSKPYVLGPLSVKSHHIPLGSIPCLNYKKAQEEEKSLRSKLASESGVISCPFTNKNDEAKEDKCKNDTAGIKTAPLDSKASNIKVSPKNSKHASSAKFPMAKISSLGETKKAKSLSPDEFKKYCAKLFEFREIKICLLYTSDAADE